jgi:hypothetical protein
MIYWWVPNQREEELDYSGYEESHRRLRRVQFGGALSRVSTEES